MRGIAHKTQLKSLKCFFNTAKELLGGGKWFSPAKIEALLVLYYFRTGRAFLLKIIIRFEPFSEKSLPSW
jgi:hypothetical protein